jgi:hypothetical protein
MSRRPPRGRRRRRRSSRVESRSCPRRWRPAASTPRASSPRASSPSAGRRLSAWSPTARWPGARSAPEWGLKPCGSGRCPGSMGPSPPSRRAAEQRACRAPLLHRLPTPYCCACLPRPAMRGRTLCFPGYLYPHLRRGGTHFPEFQSAFGQVGGPSAPELGGTASAAPDLRGRLDDELQLGSLLVDRQLVALLGGGEPALGGQAELIGVDEP